MVVGDDLAKVIRRRRTGTFEGKGIDQIERWEILFPRLDQEDLLILITEVQAIFEKGGKNGLDVRMTTLRQPLDDFVFIFECSVRQFSKRREKGGIARRLAQERARTPAGEQQ